MQCGNVCHARTVSIRFQLFIDALPRRDKTATRQQLYGELLWRDLQLNGTTRDQREAYHSTAQQTIARRIGLSVHCIFIAWTWMWTWTALAICVVSGIRCRHQSNTTSNPKYKESYIMLAYVSNNTVLRMKKTEAK